MTDTHIDKLIEAVRAGKYHRTGDNPPRFTALYEALGGPTRNVPHWPEILMAMREGPEAAADVLNAYRAQVQGVQE